MLQNNIGSGVLFSFHKSIHGYLESLFMVSFSPSNKPSLSMSIRSLRHSSSGLDLKLQVLTKRVTPSQTLGTIQQDIEISIDFSMKQVHTIDRGLVKSVSSGAKDDFVCDSFWTQQMNQRFILHVFYYCQIFLPSLYLREGSVATNLTQAEVQAEALGTALGRRYQAHKMKFIRNSLTFC